MKAGIDIITEAFLVFGYPITLIRESKLENGIDGEKILVFETSEGYDCVKNEVASELEKNKDYHFTIESIDNSTFTVTIETLKGRKKRIMDELSSEFLKAQELIDKYKEMEEKLPEEQRNLIRELIGE